MPQKAGLEGVGNVSCTSEASTGMTGLVSFAEHLPRLRESTHLTTA